MEGNLIGKRCRKLRRENELSQRQMAELLGVKTNLTIRNWENGVHPLPLEMALKLDELFQGKLLDSPDVRPWAVNGGVK